MCFGVWCKYAYMCFHSFNNFKNYKWTDDKIIVKWSPSYFHQDSMWQADYSCNLSLAKQISLIKSINWLSVTTQLESNHEWQRPMHYTEGGSTSAAQVGSGQYSFCTAWVERSGSEHDLTGWLDDIPTSPGVLLPPKQRHKTQLQLFSIQRLYNSQEKKKKREETKYSFSCEIALSTFLKGLEMSP